MKYERDTYVRHIKDCNIIAYQIPGKLTMNKFICMCFLPVGCC